MKKLNLRNPNRRGVAAVELALTLPILFLFVFATYELGRANMMMHTVEAACYESCRVGIIPGALTEESEAAARSVLATAGIRNATIRVTPSDLTQNSEKVSVEISFTFKDNSIIAPVFMGDRAITRICEMTREKL